MRKSWWTVSTGLGSLLLLLTACGGSSSSTSTSTTGTASGTATQSTASSSSSSGSATSATSSATSANAGATGSNSSPNQTAGPQPTSNAGVTFPPVGTTVLIIQHSNLGWVMAKASGYVVYTYAKDSKGGPPTCTGSCASAWAPVTGMPKAGPSDNFSGTFGTVTGPGGVKQITYNGYPLYTLVGAHVLSTKGNNVGGMWHVIMFSSSSG